MPKKKTSKSRPQTALREKLEELYPDAYIKEEEYIMDLIKERGYTPKEIEKELGHAPHRMFCDIVMRESDRTVVFEYHGEQHYSCVGNMTKTTADVMLNQKLDQEKSWILERIAIPLVAVPYDQYIDERIIEDMIEESYNNVINTHSALSECPECGRAFPSIVLPNGLCQSCWDKVYGDKENEKEQQKQSYKKQRKQQQKELRAKLAQQRKEQKERQEEKEERTTIPHSTSFSDYIENDKEELYDAGNEDYYEESADTYSEDLGEYVSNQEYYKEKQKEAAKQKRKEAYNKWKESPQYQQQKELQKQKRKEAYQRRKAELKRLGH